MCVGGDQPFPAALKFPCPPSPVLAFQNVPLPPPWPQRVVEERVLRRGLRSEKERGSESVAIVHSLVSTDPCHRALLWSYSGSLGAEYGADLKCVGSPLPPFAQHCTGPALGSSAVFLSFQAQLCSLSASASTQVPQPSEKSLCLFIFSRFRGKMRNEVCPCGALGACETSCQKGGGYPCVSGLELGGKTNRGPQNNAVEGVVSRVGMEGGEMKGWDRA